MRGGSGRGSIKALIFDFDGLIVDTEGPIFEAWQRIYRERGHELSREDWLTTIGTASAAFDPLTDLGQKLGQPLDAEEYKAVERLYYREATQTQRLLPGVDRYFTDAHRLGMKTAIASSSSREWVTDHLMRFGIHGDFDIVVCREDVQRTKPDPALYRTALQRLGSEAEEAIALEDSSNGIRAAKAAGLFCVAVPNPMTATLDLTAADLRLESLNELSLSDLIEHVRRSGRQ